MESIHAYFKKHFQVEAQWYPEIRSDLWMKHKTKQEGVSLT